MFSIRFGACRRTKYTHIYIDKQEYKNGAIIFHGTVENERGRSNNQSHTKDIKRARTLFLQFLSVVVVVVLVL